MWVLHESYDPETQVLYLDLIEGHAAPPRHEGLPEPKLLGSFEDHADVRTFSEGYLSSLAYQKDKVVREVRCGTHRKNECAGPGKPCYLGLDDFKCDGR